jgi:hypothetical protein
VSRPHCARAASQIRLCNALLRCVNARRVDAPRGAIVAYDETTKTRSSADITTMRDITLVQTKVTAHH